MADIGGLILLLGSLIGAVKGRWLPLWVPQVVAVVALGLTKRKVIA
ncbi:MAG TPA: hypothetical protein VFC58_04020 [Desulfosporosinus sp.]|nr:hypothetical protein [Desulfosporosinus sp.]